MNATSSLAGRTLLVFFALFVACGTTDAPADPGGVGGGGSNAAEDLSTGSVDGSSMQPPAADLSTGPIAMPDASVTASACTGPQDCSAGTSICCVMSQIGTGTGSASTTCTSSCP